MRTREKGFSQYGFCIGEDKTLLKWCQCDIFPEKPLLLECAERANNYLANAIYNSIVYGLSYEKLDGQEYICIGKSDFYGYRRLTLALFRNELIKKGIYPFSACLIVN